VYQNSIWLDRACPILAHDINLLTILSIDGQVVTEAFQRSHKHGRKKGETIMYDKHGIVKGGHGATISLILDERIRVV